MCPEGSPAGDPSAARPYRRNSEDALCTSRRASSDHGFDLGEALYDHVPVVGWLTRFVRSRLN